MPYSIQIVLVLLVAVAAWSDLRSRHIPNWITVPGAAFGLLLQTWYGGQHGALASLEGVALGIAMFIVFFIAGGMGAGDVKLFGAVGALVGPQALVLVFVLTGLLGGVFAAAVVLIRGHWRATLPYGAMIAAGTLLSLAVIR
jgi:prepilin peptidase CpaA